MANEPFTYASAGVDIKAGEEAVHRIKDIVRSTFRPEVIGDIGGFGGLFAFPSDKYNNPVLVGSTDGVGTKALVANAVGRYDTIGIDLVAMCVDDLVCQGAETLLFLDYISVGHVDPSHMQQLVAGVADGCRQAGCALIGGEMAEHHGAMQPGEFDLVGFALGVVERDRLISGEKVRPGDVVIGLPSPGLRSNGYSLARKVLLEHAGLSLDEPAWQGATHSLGDELLLPSVIYSPSVLSLMKIIDVHGVAHITGGGLTGNLKRVLPDDCDAALDPASWEHPPIFDRIQELGDVTAEEMAKTFNLGVGMSVVVSPEDSLRAIDHLRGKGQRAVEIGEIVDGTGIVRLS